MLKKSLLSTAFAFVLGGLVMAQAPQRSCATMDVDARLRTEDPTYAANREAIEAFTENYIATEGERAVVTIPVVVHVVYNVAAENISDARIFEQIDVLTKDFRRLNADVGETPAYFAGVAADCEVSFCLATVDPSGNPTTGITRTSTTKTSFSTADDMKFATYGHVAWDRNKYLNLWVCDLGSGLLGYAQFPGGAAATDGVVIDYAYFGVTGAGAPYNEGRTATHEVGHWLNLYHIWGDDGTGCGGSDSVADTPNQADENYGCPGGTIRISCSNGPNGDMYQNYMDYTDDGCMNLFTAGQKTRMQALFAVGGSRNGLTTSNGCGAAVTCSTPTGMSTTSIGTTSATFNWTAVAGATSYNVQYRIVGAGTWTSTTSATNSKAVTGLTAGSNYEWQVQTVCAGGTSSWTASTNFSITGGATCAVPTGMNTTSIGTTTATFNWSAAAGATSYNVRYKATAAATWTTTTSATTSKAITGLTAGTAYEWQVQTVCSGGTTSAYTASTNFSTTGGATCVDNYEPNNTNGTAATLSTGTTYGELIATSTDIDWFKFTTTSPNTKIKVNMTSLPGDYDIRLYDNAGTQKGSSINGGTTDEQIIWNATTAGTRYIKINGYAGAFNTSDCYDVLISVSSVNWKTDEAFADLASKEWENTIMGIYPNPATGSTVTVDYFSVLEDMDVLVQVYDILGRVVSSSTVGIVNGPNSIDLNVADMQSGMYFVSISSAKFMQTENFIVE